MACYAQLCERCAVCWHPKWKITGVKRCELHHIVGRRGRSPHNHRNLLMVCSECHYGYHSGGQRSLTLGQILQAKLEEDDDLDLPFLASLCGKKGLREDPQPLPQWAIDERARNARQVKSA